MANMIAGKGRKADGCVYGCCAWDHPGAKRSKSDRRVRKHQNKRREAREWRNAQW